MQIIDIMNFGRSIRINRVGVLVLILLGVIIIYFITSSSEKTHYQFLRNPNQINLRKLLIGSIQAAQRGGLEIVEVSKLAEFNKKSKGKTKEGADDPVTDADGRSHCVMKRGLHRIFPKLHIISEEDKELNKCTHDKFFDLDPTVLHEAANAPDDIVNIHDVNVWIDPLDATQEYTEKLFQYVTTMVCVAIRGVPTIGVIHNPFTKKTTWAWVDKAMSEDLFAVKREDIMSRNPVVTVSRSHAGDVKNMSKLIFGDNTNIMIAAGAGYKVLQVVFGNATAYLHTTRIKKWDICAGDAILKTLGGKMTNLLNDKINYSSAENFLNDKGLLSTLSNHDTYIRKIMSLGIVER